MKYSLILMTSLLAISVTLHTMEITDQDFILKQKNYGLKGYFYPTQDTSRLLFSFATTKDLNRSFTNHELLWSSKCKELHQDIKNEILKIRYHQIMGHSYYDNNGVLRFPMYPSISKDAFSENANYLSDSISVPNYKFTCSGRGIFWFNKGQQKALYFLLMHSRKDLYSFAEENEKNADCLMIEGSDIEFSQEIVKHIDSFPENLKKHLIDGFGMTNHYYAQTSKPSLLKAYLDQTPETRATNVALLTIITGFAVYSFTLCSSIYACSKIGNENIIMGVGIGAMARSIVKSIKASITTETMEEEEDVESLGLVTALVIGSYAAGIYTSDYILTKFNPNNTDELMALRGFEKKYFFPELEDNH